MFHVAKQWYSFYVFHKEHKMRKLKQKLPGADEAEEAIEKPDTVVFYILASSNEAIRATIATIDDFISVEFTKKVNLSNRNLR